MTLHATVRTMKYRVVLRKADGTEEKRVIDGDSRFAVYAQVEKEGASVLSLEEGGTASLPAWLQLTSGNVKGEQRITFTKNLAAMLAAGLTLSRSLSVIERQSPSKALKQVVQDLETKIKAGTSFHEALQAHPKVFSPLFIAMTKAAEESGTLSDTLKIVSRQMEQSAALTRKIKGAMIYPSIILIAIVIIGVLMMIFVVPTLTATFSQANVALPLSTQIIMGVSDFMQAHAVITLAALVAVIAGSMFALRTKKGGQFLLWTAMHAPVISELTKETYSARAARTLSSLLSSGVEMLVALSITREVVGENPFGRVVSEAEEGVRKGDALSLAFVSHPKLYPILVGDMIAVGEETGKVADMLSQVANYYEEDVSERTKDLSTIIEPLLMLFIGAFVGIFAVSMIAPIYSLSSSI